MSTQYFTRTTLIAAALAVSTLMPLAAQARVDVDINVGPPPARVVVAPPPRAGYIYAPGYWKWDAPAHRHVWVEGRYIPQRHGRHWVNDHWVQRGPNWHYVPGHWVRG